MLRRRYGTFQWLSLPMSLPATQMVPPSGSSSLVNRRRKVDFPEPEGPTRNTNSPLAMSTEAARMATVVPLYDLVMFSSLIMMSAKGRCAPHGAARNGETGYQRLSSTDEMVNPAAIAANAGMPP